MMVDATSISRICASTVNERPPTARCGSAPPSRPLPLHSIKVSASKKSSKSTKQQLELPPKSQLQSEGSTTAVKKRRVPPGSEKTSKIHPSTTYSTMSNIKIPPFHQNCSLALSRTESIMVSAAGDVIVCRCRRSSKPFLPAKARDPLNVWDKQFPCCDTEILSNIDGAWSPVVIENVGSRKKGRARTGSVSQISTSTDFSTYEWEKTNIDTINNNATTGMGEKVLKRSSAITTNIDQRKSDSTNSDEHINKNDSIFENNDCAMEMAVAHTEPKVPLPHRYRDENTADDDLILSLPSFDYSHIIEGHNDMIPQTDRRTKGRETKNSGSLPDKVQHRRKSTTVPTLLASRTDNKSNQQASSQSDYNQIPDNGQQFFHGVPLFLSTLSQVRITKVSANPLGAHVLMISQEALLFTYGLNHRGQLGIGFQSEIKNNERGFHTTPTLITPLLENGGKAINCAAGVDHSLVVVATESRRVQKLQTNPDAAQSACCSESYIGPNSPKQTVSIGMHEGSNEDEKVEEGLSRFSETPVQYHQVYGFGRNNFMKLGLLRPHFSEGNPKGESMDDVVLPRRVGLHCTVWSHEIDINNAAFPSRGVFDIAASNEHSAALVRRPTGDIEVYMWGNASLGALGLPLDMKCQEIRGEIARKPSFKEERLCPLPTVVESLCYRRDNDLSSPFATQVSLGPYCSFIVMSDGKCMSCGFSAEGMLGHSYNTTFSLEPCEVFLPLSESEVERSNRIVSVSAGAFHVLALSDDGNVFSWGINSNERLGLGSFDYSSIPTGISGKRENLVVIEWVPQKIDIEEKNAGRCGKTKNDGTAMNRISLACAGFDSSFLVMESGKVLSFGKRSGRLGKGEISSNVNTPEPLYGGLHLFHHRTRSASEEPLKAITPKTPLTCRSVSTSAIP